MSHANNDSPKPCKGASILVLCILVLAICIVICLIPVKTTSVSAEITSPTIPQLSLSLPDDRHLKLEVNSQRGANDAHIFPRGKGSPYKTVLRYIDTNDVNIEVDGAVIRLEDAFADGQMTWERFWGDCQIDAMFGNCEMYTKARGGLSFLVFRYPEYELRFTNSFESLPSGEKSLVHELYVCKNDNELNSNASKMTQEDWGLTFEVVNANATSLTLRCIQSGGCQLGELLADFFFVDLESEEGTLPILDGAKDASAYEPKQVIARNAETEITLDWSDFYGKIPAGDYVMTLKVCDVYDPERTQQDMLKFEMRQNYLIPFSVSEREDVQ